MYLLTISKIAKLQRQWRDFIYSHIFNVKQETDCPMVGKNYSMIILFKVRRWNFFLSIKYIDNLSHLSSGKKRRCIHKNKHIYG